MNIEELNKQSELLFGIKRKIPDNLIKIIDYSEQEYQLETTVKQKFIVFKFNKILLNLK